MHPINPSIHSGIGGTMYLLLIVLVPVLLLVNTRALDSSPYKAAYED
jgi:hypothetical protein